MLLQLLLGSQVSKCRANDEPLRFDPQLVVA